MKKRYLTTVIALLFSIITYGQDKVIKGKVVSTDGSPLPGVSIVLEGTTTATSSAVDGTFEITVPAELLTTDKKPNLVFSFIGLKTVIKSVDEDMSNVTIEDDIAQLMEVIAVGYGTQEKQDVTGSISTIKAKDINYIPVTSYEQALQGRSPGLQVEGAGGQLGGEQRIRIRGSSSLGASNQPLIVIDGIIVTSDDQTNFVDNNPSNPLSEINPNDIESVETLKDAAAAAIYGARGSNGVILITTKKGAEGKTKFNANIATGFNEATNIRKFLNRDQYITMFTDAAKNSGYVEGPDYATQADATDAAWGDAGGGPYSGYGSFSDLVSRGVDENWHKAAFRRGKVSQYDLSASGGTEKTKFFGSLGYRTEEGIIVKNSMDRFNGRFNVDHTVNAKIKFGVNISQNVTTRNNVPEGNQFNSPLEANAISPLVAIRDRTGEYSDSTFFYANAFRAVFNNKDISTSVRNISNLYGSWEIIKGLNFRSEFGNDIMFMTEYGWNGSKFPVSAGTPSSGKYGTSRVFNYTLNNTLTYTRTFAEKHNFIALVGTSYQSFFGEYSFMNALGLPSDDFQYLTSASKNTTYSSSATEYTFLSYFGRINYKFNNKYLVGVSLRTDGSSRFGTNTRYGTFPALSVGWIISEEGFYKNSGISNVLSLLKLKASIGLTGNSEINNYAARGLYSAINYGGKSGLVPSQLENPTLTWEKTTQYDVGIEFGFLKNRINGGVDVYEKNTTDLLLGQPIPATSGFSNTTRNVGKMYNRGVDVYINAKILTNAFKWSVAYNISSYKNEITDMNGGEILPTGRSLNGAIVGQPTGVFYGVEFAGVDPENGDALYRLADGSVTNNWNTANQRANYKVLGNPNPDHYGGHSHTFEYKGFDLSVFGQWSYGNDIYLSSGVFQNGGFQNYYTDNQTVDQFNYWRNPGDVTNVPRPDFTNNGARTSSRYVSDGSYLRLKNVTLGYTLPKNWISKIKFTSIRVYVSGQNLLTATPYNGNDPEVNYYTPSATTVQSNLAAGVDYYSAPQMRTLMAGINLGF